MTNTIFSAGKNNIVRNVQLQRSYFFSFLQKTRKDLSQW